jgi:hypothetical protein
MSNYRVNNPSSKQLKITYTFLMAPIRFMAIASGQVFTKYWLPAYKRGVIEIVGTITLEDPEISQLDPAFESIPVYLTNSEQHTLNLLIEHSDKFEAIALLVPADIRLTILKKILSEPRLNLKKIYLEKPFTRSLLELEEYFELIKENSSRLHFAGKYAYGRADLLIQKLLDYSDFPIFINATMIEGTKYFSKITGNIEENLYVKDGPELDIGFHMLNIVSLYIQSKKVKIVDIKVNENSVKDLSAIRPYFLKKFGFAAEVTFLLDNQIQIPVFLSVGKADCVSERHIDFDFQDKRVVQHYTVTNAKDPVFVIEEDTATFIGEHPIDYLYYSRELSPSLFCKQSKQEQINSIDINRVCLEIKHRREN